MGADCRGSCWGLDRPGGGDAATGVDKIAHHDQTGSLQVFSREGRAATFHSFVFIFMMKGITEKRNLQTKRVFIPTPKLNEFFLLLQCWLSSMDQAFVISVEFHVLHPKRILS